MDGNPVTLSKLVRDEPAWAANQIRHRDQLERENQRIKEATSYTKSYNGEFPHAGQLECVDLEYFDENQGPVKIARISCGLLETMMHDISRDINTPHLIQGARRILRSDDCRADQLRKLDVLFMPNAAITDP